ncbi:trk2p [Saccharomyces arboricola H-6]|uniref:Potassium transport protein n=1 Tax=Saccharomyces arboricola (strain H-6 / AS 2.3317 / CBS 10644) TaxID=1160507 RepID=J8LLB7_SACAR|nr:trk2p [Saccharomyces arboricola H-6]
MSTARRTQSRASLALPFQLRLVHKKSWGHQLRDSISKFQKSCKPVARYVFPNFIVVHYIYLITLSIVGSILLYPCKNTPYIDVLFLAAGASTQGGLATKSTNDFNLYQQIVVYIITCLSTPIIIHGFLAFVRLYWFERYFDNIRDFSRQNFKLRRTMTLKQRELSDGSDSGVAARNRSFKDNLFRGRFVSREDPQQPTDSPGSFASSSVSPLNVSSSKDNSSDTQSLPSQHFSGKRQNSDVDPTDIYKSIMMLHGQHQRDGSDPTASSHSMDDGPAYMVQERRERRGPYLAPERRSISPNSQELDKLAQTEGSQKLPFLQRDEGDYDYDYDYDHASRKVMATPQKSVPKRQSQYASECTHPQVHEIPSKVPQYDEKPAKSTPSSSVDEEMSFSPQESTNLQFQAHPPKPNRPAGDTQHPFTRTTSTNYLSWQPTFGRNSVFIGLTRQQKEELGGVEYRALRLLCNILVIYYVGFNIVAFVIVVPWICTRQHYAEIVRQNGVSPTWWGFFTAMSSFTNLGLALTSNSMVSFSTAPYPLIFMMLFIIIGNTGFPIVLRFVIWIMFKTSKDLSQFKESLGFLLDHPRRCFTLLFPSAPTWWLFITLVFLNATDWILFIILDFDSAVIKQIAKGYRVLMGLFQSVCTRTAGFNVVDLSKLHPSIQVSYMLMMYVSVLPLAISIRRTNVYEEQSLGLYDNDQGYGDITDEDDTTDNYNDDGGEQNEPASPKAKAKHKPKKHSPRSFVGAHLRKQLSFDLWFLFLGLFIICICESRRIQDANEPDFNVFSILFEIVSAYGTVGLSLGYPNTNTSLSAQFTVFSKLVIIAMLIRGRNRGLPYTLDRAIMLPSSNLEKIDRLQDMKAKGKLLAKVDEDPMTTYVKKRSHKLRKVATRFWKRH